MTLISIHGMLHNPFTTFVTLSWNAPECTGVSRSLFHLAAPLTRECPHLLHPARLHRPRRFRPARHVQSRAERLNALPLTITLISGGDVIGDVAEWRRCERRIGRPRVAEHRDGTGGGGHGTGV